MYLKYWLLALQEGDKIKNRSKLDIIYDILVSATGGVKKNAYYVACKLEL